MKGWIEFLFPYFVVAVLAYCLISLSGCLANSADGFGTFVSGIGQDIQDASQTQLDNR